MLINVGHGKVTPSDADRSKAGPKKAGRKRDGGLNPAWQPKGSCCSSRGKGPEPFRFMFDGPGLTPAKDIAQRLDNLSQAMVAAAANTGDSSIPAIFTYWGQFIDHDITANTDRESADPRMARFNIDRPDIAPVARDDLEKNRPNLRVGTLGLDSVYGDGPAQKMPATHSEAKKKAHRSAMKKAMRAMRDPADPAKMRLGRTSPTADPIPAPHRPTADLPRFGAVMGNGAGQLTLTEVKALTGAANAAEARRTALIGDARNDENLNIAQFHLAFLRFHNAIVDRVCVGTDRQRFCQARRLVSWTYQWLVVNQYLPTVCDPTVVRDVLDNGAPVYARLLAQHPKRGKGCLPMPVEFSVAAFRFGHSMIRGNYDFNQNFPFPIASLGLLFDFTGGGGLRDGDVLPDNWIIEWERFLHGGPNQTARKIDSTIVPPLNRLDNERFGRILASLAGRNLRRSYVFDVPTAQSVLIDLKGEGVLIPELTRAELTSGPTGKALKDNGFVDETPLWFYVLKEAEVVAKGEHLGPLGSRLVSETLIGLIKNDDCSYLATNPAWTPTDEGIPVHTIEDMLRVANVLQ